MTHLEIYIRFKQLSLVSQPLSVAMLIGLNLTITSVLGPAPSVAGLVYFIIALCSWEAMLVDTEIDMIAAAQRTDRQKAIQYISAAVGYLRLILALIVYVLTIIALML